MVGGWTGDPPGQQKALVEAGLGTRLFNEFPRDFFMTARPNDVVRAKEEAGLIRPVWRPPQVQVSNSEALKEF